MFYKTLHTYILRELLRTFILTSLALTTLMAFGGTFKPLTKEGLDLVQLMLVMLNLMPAMMAYAIPLAALFAAVLGYWRMSTDNEIIACRAGGLSFFSILLPALILGISVAVTDFAFVNFVVPLFFQRTEQVVRRDLGSLLAYNISRQEPFEFEKKLIVYADAAALTRTKSPEGTDRSIVNLTGMAATQLDKFGNASTIIVAQRAAVYFDETKNGQAANIWIQMQNGAAYDPRNFRKIGGSVDRLPPVGQNYTIASQLRDKPKFLNVRQLKELNDHPDINAGIRSRLDSMASTLQMQETSENLARLFTPHVPLKFESIGDEIEVEAPTITLTGEKVLALQGSAADPVKVSFVHRGKTRYMYAASGAEFDFVSDDFPTPHLVGSLKFTSKDIRRIDLIQNITAPETEVTVQPLELPPAVVVPVKPLDVEAINTMAADFTPNLVRAAEDTRQQVSVLMLFIRSEMHSRVSFAVSCLTLVLLGAALGIQLRGRNPLAVFVVGFVPALILVMLITAGRQMVETGSPSAARTGFYVIWAGNALILAMVAAVYAKLLRR
jgi:lipopolysaccharide export system permease protein